jgi:hypothetical protein
MVCGYLYMDVTENRRYVTAVALGVVAKVQIASRCWQTSALSRDRVLFPFVILGPGLATVKCTSSPPLIEYFYVITQCQPRFVAPDCAWAPPASLHTDRTTVFENLSPLPSLAYRSSSVSSQISSNN